MTATQIIITILGTVLTSNGLWALFTHMYDAKHSNETAQSKMLKGLGHDRICYLGECYIERGSITRDEYENIHDYLYKPYRALGGNGTAEKIMKEVDGLPIKERS